MKSNKYSQKVTNIVKKGGYKCENNLNCWNDTHSKNGVGVVSKRSGCRFWGGYKLLFSVFSRWGKGLEGKKGWKVTNIG